MSLSCSCFDYDADWYYEVANDFMVLDTKRSRKCCSCGKRIAVVDEAVKVYRNRPAREGVEMNIYGDDHDAVSMSPWYLCETCGGLYWSIEDLGMCCSIENDIAAQIRDYMEASK